MLRVNSKGKPRHFKRWLWNKDVDVAVCRKSELFRIWKQSRNGEDRLGGGGERLISCCDGRGLIRIAKQRAGEKRDAAGVS